MGHSRWNVAQQIAQQIPPSDKAVYKIVDNFTLGSFSNTTLLIEFVSSFLCKLHENNLQVETWKTWDTAPLYLPLQSINCLRFSTRTFILQNRDVKSRRKSDSSMLTRYPGLFVIFIACRRRCKSTLRFSWDEMTSSAASSPIFWHKLFGRLACDCFDSIVLPAWIGSALQQRVYGNIFGDESYMLWSMPARDRTTVTAGVSLLCVSSWSTASSDSMFRATTRVSRSVRC